MKLRKIKTKERRKYIENKTRFVGNGIVAEEVEGMSAACGILAKHFIAFCIR